MKNVRMPIFFPLYHGTNTKAQNMSPEERKKVYELCNYVAKISYDFIINKHITSKNKDINVLKDNIKLLIQGLKDKNENQYMPAKINIDNLFSEIDDKYSIVSAIRIYYSYSTGDSNFQYGDMYLTLDLNRAKKHAKDGSSFGEFSVIANNLYKQAKQDGLLNELKEEDLKKINTFEDEINSPGNPIVLKYEGLYEDELLHENGDEITEDEWEHYANTSTFPSGFRVKKDVDLNERLTKKISI